MIFDRSYLRFDQSLSDRVRAGFLCFSEHATEVLLGLSVDRATCLSDGPLIGGLPLECTEALGNDFLAVGNN